ncbi:hypothetical protein B0A52_07204 [Exophiala mesophila]|uniref:F-box domain-containing protein n=1 Tax=Exophiala mesophila TaxID=212818 RepID=A0A438N0I3_EXOME|nr:hypothetical protein B0A52_07204 [Exophiala mesophila]
MAAPEASFNMSRSPRSSLESSSPSLLLSLPPEVRNLIYKFAFTQAEPMKLRSPSQKRLRPSRPAKDDARGFLDTCRFVRSEAISLYYSLNPLVFRQAKDVLSFIADTQIHPHIKSSIQHLAIDFRDVRDADTVLKEHISFVDGCLGHLPRLKAIETRFYARQKDACSLAHFRTVAMAFDSLDVEMNAPPSPPSPRSPRSSICSADDLSDSSIPPSPIFETTPWKPSPQPDFSALQAETLELHCFDPSAASAFAHAKLKFSVALSVAAYPGAKHDKLRCYNLKMSSDGVPNALGGAKDAVNQRLKSVGALPRAFSELYDTAADGGFHQKVRATIATCGRIDVGVS